MSRKRMNKLLSVVLGMLSIGGSASVGALDDVPDYGSDVVVIDPGVGRRDDYDYDLSFDSNDLTSSLKESLDLLSNLSGQLADIKRRISASTVPAGNMDKETSESLSAVSKAYDAAQNKVDSASKRARDLLSRGTGYQDDQESSLEFAASVVELQSSASSSENEIKQLLVLLSDFEGRVKSATKNVELDDVSSRKANYSMLVSRVDAISSNFERFKNELSEADILGGVDSTYQADFNNDYNSIADRLSSVRALMSAGDRSMSDEKFRTCSGLAAQLEESLKDVFERLNRKQAASGSDNAFSIFTNTIGDVNQAWDRFQSQCNAGRLDVPGIEKSMRSKAELSFNKAKESYDKLFKELDERSTAAIGDEAADVDIGALKKECKAKFADFERVLVNSKKIFDTLARYEATRLKPMSRAEIGEAKKNAFKKACDEINSNASLSKSQKHDALVEELCKYLPGRREIHTELLNLLSTPLEFDPSKGVELEQLQRKNIILFGGVGVGKTEEMRAVISAAGLKRIDVKASDFADSASMEDFWNRFAPESSDFGSGVVLVFDEIDSILPKRLAEGEDGYSPGVANFNLFMDKLVANPSVLRNYRGMIASTNMGKGSLDNALLDRFAVRRSFANLSGAALLDVVKSELSTVTLSANDDRSNICIRVRDIIEENKMSIRQFKNILGSLIDRLAAKVSDPTKVVVPTSMLYSALNGMAPSPASADNIASRGRGTGSLGAAPSAGSDIGAAPSVGGNANFSAAPTMFKE